MLITTTLPLSLGTWGYTPLFRLRGPQQSGKCLDASKSRGCQMLFLRDTKQFGVRETKTGRESLAFSFL